MSHPICKVEGCEKRAKAKSGACSMHVQRMGKWGSYELPPRTSEGNCLGCGESLAGLLWTPKRRTYCGSECLRRAKWRRQDERRRGRVARVPMPAREDGERPGISVEDFLAAQRPRWARDASPVPDAWSRRGDVMDSAAGAP